MAASGDGQTRPPVIVNPGGGMKFVAEVRGHSVVTDQPESAGGEDSAVMPLELLGASLGTCIALYVAKFCQARGIDSEGLRIEIETATAKDPYRITRFDVLLVLPDGVPAHYRELVERVARTCPVHNTLLHSPEIQVVITAGDLVAI